jgi:hypothetical protein
VVKPTTPAIKKLEREIEEADAHAKELKDNLRAMKADAERIRLEPLRSAAKRAHDLLCQYNHTDGCSWGYEGDNWDGCAHSRWLGLIDSILTNRATPITLAELDKFLSFIETLKKDFPEWRHLLRGLHGHI